MLNVRCKCGEEMSAPDEALGSNVKCQSCGRSVRLSSETISWVPGSVPALGETTPFGLTDASSLDDAESPSVPSSEVADQSWTLVGKKVRVRFRRYFREQRLYVFIGTVLHWTGQLLVLNGKGIVLVKGRTHPAVVDKTMRTLVAPIGNIAHIRVLPDDFQMADIRLRMEGLIVYVIVAGAADTAIGEQGED